MNPADRTFAEIDVSGWSYEHEEPLGSKPKRWLRDPDSGTYWLMKDATFNKRSDGSVYRKGDDWAERIGCAVAETLALPAADVELAAGGPGAQTALGVISRSVLLAGESLVHGNELLAEVGVSGTDPYDRTGYTLDAVRLSLAQVDPPASGGLSTWDAFVGYLIFDALVGNTDRHQENWAVIGRGRDRRLAPTFDHASCLGFLLDDDQRRERLTSLDENRSPEAYAARARSRFEGRPSPLTLASEGVASLTAEARGRLLDRCSDATLLVAPIAQVPSERMSEPAREFAERVLRWNQTQLLSQAFGTV